MKDAFELLQKSIQVDSKYGKSLSEIGFIYAAGKTDGVLKDPQQAAVFMRRAAETGGCPRAIHVRCPS